MIPGTRQYPLMVRGPFLMLRTAPPPVRKCRVTARGKGRDVGDWPRSWPQSLSPFLMQSGIGRLMI